MYKKLIREIEQLPEILTRQQLINWYIDNRQPYGCKEMTTGQLISLCKKCGKKIQGQSKLAIHITPEEEREFIRRSKPYLSQSKIHSNAKIKEEEKEKIRDLYWNKGLTIEELAELYKCSTSTVGLFMKNAKIPARLRGFGRSC